MAAEVATCAVCAQTLGDESVTASVPCKHRFHKSCLITNACPVCALIASDENIQASSVTDASASAFAGSANDGGLGDQSENPRVFGYIAPSEKSYLGYHPSGFPLPEP